MGLSVTINPFSLWKLMSHFGIYPTTVIQNKRMRRNAPQFEERKILILSLIDYLGGDN